MSTFWKLLHPGRRGRPSGDARPTTPDVDRVLDAARAAGTPRELAREDDTVMIFHRAHLAHVAGGDEVAAASPRRALQALVATGGVVAVMSTGIAVAASGHAPWSHTPGPAASAGRHGAVGDDESTSRPGSTATSSATTTAPAARTHGLRGLCRAYAAARVAEKDRALAGPAFAGLVAAAGSVDAVPAFCGVVLTADAASDGRSDVTRPAHPSHPAHPAHPAHPTSPAHPTHPSHPAHPTQGATASRPVHPSHPAHPTQGATPTRPAHPTQGATPTRPAHPAHSAHPSHS